MGTEGKSAWARVRAQARKERLPNSGSFRPGAEHRFAAYTEEEVKAIRRSRAAKTRKGGLLSLRELAEIFGGKPCTIWKAAVGRTYRNVKYLLPNQEG